MQPYANEEQYVRLCLLTSPRSVTFLTILSFHCKATDHEMACYSLMSLVLHPLAVLLPLVRLNLCLFPRRIYTHLLDKILLSQFTFVDVKVLYNTLIFPRALYVSTPW